MLMGGLRISMMGNGRKYASKDTEFFVNVPVLNESQVKQILVNSESL